MRKDEPGVVNQRHHVGRIGFGGDPQHPIDRVLMQERPGEPASAIVAVTEDGEDITITPLFVSVTPGMILVDHDDTTAGALGRFQVQQHTLCDGWINTWSVIEADGTQTPQTFASYAEAKAELAEFLDDIAADIETGDRGEDSGFEREEFRIVPVT